jgi:hypothetical protein
VPHGLFIAWPAAITFAGGRKMPSTFADRALQAKLLREMQGLNERKLKLELDMKALDSAIDLHMEKGALRDIAAYKHLNHLFQNHADQIRKLTNPHEKG